MEFVVATLACNGSASDSAHFDRVLCADLNMDNFDDVVISRNSPWGFDGENFFYFLAVHENNGN